MALLASLLGPLRPLVPLVSRRDSRADSRADADEARAETHVAVRDREVAVSARLEAEAATRRVIDQSPDAYVSVDEQGGLTEWNPAAEEIFGWTRDEVLGLDVGELLLSSARADLHRRQVADFRATRTSTIIGRHPDVPMSARDGRLLRIDCVVWSVADEHGRTSLHTFMTDVTDRQAAADDLRRADDDLSTFSAAMAHDLRVPLTVIKGYAELLAHEVEPEGLPSTDWVERLDAAADRGVALIDDILRYLGVGRVLATREPVDLTTLVEQVVAEHLGATDRDTDIRVEPLPPVTGDERLLSQLFGNLVGNALKYVPADRRVEVVVDAVVDAPGCVVVRVADNGDTLDADDRDRIFSMFDRGSSADPAVAGSGVGLAVSRRIAELHGGDVTVEAVPGGGTRFCVRLSA